MALFDLLTGGSNKRTSNYNYGSYGNSSNKPTATYQCSYCGRRENVVDARYLSNNSCLSRGRDSRGLNLPHDWRRL